MAWPFLTEFELFTVAMCKVVMEAVAEGGHIASAA